MTDLLDDVKALLDKDFGDDRILKQICRACEHNEVISNYEKNYVKKLAEKHLGRKPEFIPTIEAKPSTPDVVIQDVPLQTQSYKTDVPRKSYSKLKNKKIMLGIGGIALIVIIATAVSLSGISIGTKTNTDTNTPIEIVDSLSIETDSTSYITKDLISISGTSDIAGTVNLSIENQNNELVWSETVSIKNNGKFSTLAIAGGTGWDNSGTYTVKVDDGNEIKSSTFSFTA